MTFVPLRFESYEASETQPNVVVDGSPNAATVLTLTHWPGHPAPHEDLADDLSAQMAFRYLDHDKALHGEAEVVTNNHFDQDGLVAVYALCRPEEALAQRRRLEDVAAAGDFATYRDRDAARLSMVLAAYADPDRSPLAPLPPNPEASRALLYSELVGRLPELLDDIDGRRSLWQEEDSALARSEGALARGDVVVEEHPRLDLAVVTVGDDRPRAAGRYLGVHPMALHNATDRGAVLVLGDHRYELTYRYETWVQYRSRRPRPRVDLGPLADELTAAEAGDVGWIADDVGALRPRLRIIGGEESTLTPAEVTAHVLAHLRQAPPAWDPYTARARNE